MAVGVCVCRPLRPCCDGDGVARVGLYYAHLSSVSIIAPKLALPGAKRTRKCRSHYGYSLVTVTVTVTIEAVTECPLRYRNVTLSGLGNTVRRHYQHANRLEIDL